MPHSNYECVWMQRQVEQRQPREMYEMKLKSEMNSMFF